METRVRNLNESEALIGKHYYKDKHLIIFSLDTEKWINPCIPDFTDNLKYNFLFDDIFSKTIKTITSTKLTKSQKVTLKSLYEKKPVKGGDSKWKKRYRYEKRLKIQKRIQAHLFLEDVEYYNRLYYDFSVMSLTSVFLQSVMCGSMDSFCILLCKYKNNDYINTVIDKAGKEVRKSVYKLFRTGRFISYDEINILLEIMANDFKKYRNNIKSHMKSHMEGEIK